MHLTPLNFEPVSATLEYLQSAIDKPVTHMLAPPDAHVSETSCYASTAVMIADGRSKVTAPVLEREGFQLCNAPSVMRTFREREEIQRIYYHEMEDLARSVSGASQAIVFDHLVRRRASRGLSPFGAREGLRPSTATRAHCDFTSSSAQRRLADAPPRESIEIRCLLIFN